ncbi:hypothetical protein GJV26_05180 [Massilia dura]|uniref:Uncharacterized protein n=1 Tax=Pseudoduganella dura TaxID=321982 RepID=A0A6I3XBF5_9BURK|nr:hypothetical protein [Pseudoduganella dura]MUI11880.1 hypothetical protein [Pseudoduganella dura]GGY08975.1 hypothetical protein GCM10007386_44360 [Pseudoduganella dura]
MQNERRTLPNEPVAEAVDATVELMPNISRYQAALVMARDGVPPRVIRRVLDEPAQRRATDKIDQPDKPST